MDVLVKIKKYITLPLKHILHPKCKKCNKGYIVVDRVEYFGSVEFNVYKCNYCHKEYI